jgi:hypothetical protein
MASSAEQHIARLIRPILDVLPASADLLQSEDFRHALIGLDFFIPEILAEIYPEWIFEELDGIDPVLARKVGDREIEILGLCTLISDQTLTPIHLRFWISPREDEVTWMECRLGERGRHGMIRQPHTSFDKAIKPLYTLQHTPEDIDWMYKVTFGERS